MKSEKFKKRPTCILAFVGYYRSRKRAYRSYNAVHDKIRLFKEEVIEINNLTEFIRRPASSSTLKELRTKMLSLCEQCWREKEDIEHSNLNCDQSELHKLICQSKVFVHPAEHNKGYTVTFWEVWGVMNPGLQDDRLTPEGNREMQQAIVAELLSLYDSDQTFDLNELTGKEAKYINEDFNASIAERMENKQKAMKRKKCVQNCEGEVESTHSSKKARKDADEAAKALSFVSIMLNKIVSTSVQAQHAKDIDPNACSNIWDVLKNPDIYLTTDGIKSTCECLHSMGILNAAMLVGLSIGVFDEQIAPLLKPGTAIYVRKELSNVITVE